MDEKERMATLINVASKIIPASQGSFVSLEPIAHIANRRPNVLMSDQRVMYNQATMKMREIYEKETGKDVKPGSAIQYVMNQAVSLLSANQDQRKLLGVPNATDDQIALTFVRIAGSLATSNNDMKIIGQNQTREEADKMRKELFDAFYDGLNNGHKPELTDEQKMWQIRLYDTLATASYGNGGGMMSFEETKHGNFGVVDPTVYNQTFESTIDKRRKSWLK